jgi:hypothetical protein
LANSPYTPSYVTTLVSGSAVVPPLASNVIVYSLAVSVHVAVNVLLPVDPRVIVSVGSQLLNVTVYPVKLYGDGSNNVIASSTVYVAGLLILFVPPFITYDILYVTIFHLAYRVKFVVNVIGHDTGFVNPES